MALVQINPQESVEPADVVAIDCYNSPDALFYVETMSSLTLVDSDHAQTAYQQLLAQAGFVQVHADKLVNRRHICHAKVDNGTVIITLSTGEKVTVAHSYVSHVRSNLSL